MSRTIRQKLDQLSEIEQRNQQRISSFDFDSAEIERKRSRLAWIEGYTRDRAGFEGIRDQIIARYHAELDK